MPLPVNHHAEHPGFSGLAGTLYGLIFLLTGRRNARQANEITQITGSDHVVDIGCGPGNAARMAARCGARVTAVDPAAAMLRVARMVTRRDARILWAEGTAEAIPVADGAATVVWALATVHHWRDVTGGLAEVHRVLGPGGRLLVVERRSPQDATGFASHGWTEQQAYAFAALCRDAGLGDVVVDDRDSTWIVSAHRK